MYTLRTERENNMTDIETRLMDLEVFASNQERVSDDLSAEVLRLNRRIFELERIIDRLKNEMNETLVKPIGEETPPPHY
jgi:uncharacterized coiled-coil protein SlyX